MRFVSCAMHLSPHGDVEDLRLAHVGVVNYLFASRLGRQVKDARAKERETERRLGAAPP